MAQQPVVILASGGIRSLVTTAVLMSRAEKPPLILLHLKDGRENAPVRLNHVRRQAEHFHINQCLELELPHLQTDQGGQGNAGGASWSPLVRSQILLVGLAQAIQLHASHLIWPAQFNGDYACIARITEQTVLTLHLAQLDHAELPLIDTPLLELTDQQMVELGGQLEVPWQLAWTCLMQADRPCRMCPACRRRRAAFDRAGMVDPADRPAPVAR